MNWLEWILLDYGKIGFEFTIRYAIWSGLGMVLVAMVGMFVFGQKLDIPAIVGMLLIITGVVVMNVL